jgi:heterodisulfide reductase subunit A-like polyferredoxin
MRSLALGLLLLVIVCACGSDAATNVDFNERAVQDFLDELHFSTTDQLAVQMLADARYMCTGKLDERLRAVIKVSVGQGSDRILRAGCPDRVALVVGGG